MYSIRCKQTKAVTSDIDYAFSSATKRFHLLLDKFSCKDCDGCYIGETNKIIYVKVQEHKLHIGYNDE